ncbi:ankyrin repeat and SOCS box protein 18-like [Saccoglossus kowalevskii]|uniref:Serine/threonine-protein phosphatase 6 regulatory ankyrin repeat subunit A-like n=1 Tax=Saccoglossus kowalevskii TaxID=10224 RepID=A0ABM0MK21_SACKO|nr:PREDICTED: serine/threonine-protein phosphatase 6 regulatory ankyrin repeat subunit A-like [Saccoglossus kowalevskii]
MADAQLALSCVYDDSASMKSLLDSPFSPNMAISQSSVERCVNKTTSFLWQRIVSHFNLEKVTLLQLTSLYGSCHVMQVLLCRGACVNTAGNSQSQALCFAFLALEFKPPSPQRKIDYEKCLSMLLQAGADASVPALIRWPLLHRALDAELSSNILVSLIQNGADINGIDNRRMTVLHFAVVYDKNENIELLLELGADVNKQGPGGMTALSYAANFGKDAKCDRLKILYLHGGNPDITNNYGRTALHSACAGGVAEHIDYLTDKVTDINTMTQDGDTPLDLALKNICNFNLYCPGACVYNQEYSTLVGRCFMKLLNYGAKLNRMTIETTQSSIFFLPEVLCTMINSVTYIDLRGSDYTCPDATPTRYRKFYDIIFSLGGIPSTLSHLCRCQIRSYLRNQCHQSINKLNLPKRLKLYLLLEPSLSLDLD